MKVPTRFLLVALAVGAALLAGVPSAAAQGAMCPVVHVPDASGDEAGTAGGDAIDVVAACVAGETATHLELLVQTSGDMEPTASEFLEYSFHFTFNGNDLVAVTTVDATNGATPTESADSATVSGNVLTMTVPKSAVGYDATTVGSNFTQLFVSSRADASSQTTGTLAEGSDRAPDSGFGVDYTAGALAPATQDTDGDRLPDRHEIANGTDPRSVDTDFDGLLDGPDVTLLPGDPNATIFEDAGVLSEDTGSGTTYYGEMGFGSDPLVPDTDGDGLVDGASLSFSTDQAAFENITARGAVPTRMEGGTAFFAGEFAFGADPNATDTDGDGLSDGEETVQTSRHTYQNSSAFSGFPGSTDPTVPDTDGDGLSDHEEVFGATADGVSFSATDPNARDTDRDGVPDGAEVRGLFTDPVDANKTVSFAPTDPTLFDTDGDGWSDEQELAEGSNPTDPLSVPQPVEEDKAFAAWLYALLSTIMLLVLVLLAVIGILVRWG